MCFVLAVGGGRFWWLFFYGLRDRFFRVSTVRVLGDRVRTKYSFSGQKFGQLNTYLRACVNC